MIRISLYQELVKGRVYCNYYAMDWKSIFHTLHCLFHPAVYSDDLFQISTNSVTVLSIETTSEENSLPIIPEHLTLESEPEKQKSEIDL